jgi:hypothetical protein
MHHKKEDAWDEKIRNTRENPLLAFDDIRHRCPIAHSTYFNWSLFRHQDIVDVVNDHQRFSNKVSAHVSVPNGMDQPEHTRYRAIVERHFSAEVLEKFEPRCQTLACNLVENLPRHTAVDIIPYLAQPFALQVQCTFLGWPEARQDSLAQWMQKNYHASLAQDRAATTAVAQEFSEFIHDLLDTRRAAGTDAPQDIITELLYTRVDDRLLYEDEIVSVLRNWTAGEVGTISAAVGILVHFIATQPELQQILRRQPEKLPEAIDEILRIHGPLISNRRITRCPVNIGNQQLNENEHLTLFWVAANRDEKVFADPTTFRWGRDQTKNLLYGTGIHACPGAELARMELRLIISALLANTSHIALVPDQTATYAQYPACGFSQLSVLLC